MVMSQLFVCEEGEAVNCSSTWQSNRSSRESDSQTSDVTYMNSGSQSKFLSTVEVQTDAAMSNEKGSVDITELAAWLARVTPHVLEELEKNSRSRVFDDYKLQETMDYNIKHLSTFSFEEKSNFATSAVDWSSTGGMLAIARSATKHPSWCEHPGCVSLHQTNRQGLQNSSDRRLDVSSCVTALSCHPNDSFILACGTVSGEVIVWNLQRDDAVIIGSITIHSESVIHLEWIQHFNVTNMQPVLASASRDGSIIIWTMKSISNSMKASQCFLLQAEKDVLDLGIVCAKFNPSNPSLFLTGIEGGSVAICSTDSRRPCHRKRTPFCNNLDCCDPIVNVLDGHKGSVTGVQWVPGSLDLFLSSGSDSELHVYSFADLSLLRIIYLSEPSYGLQITPSHSNIAVSWGASGSIHLHDIYSSEAMPPIDLEHENSKKPLSVICIRSSSSLQFALGASDGTVYVWQVPHSMFSMCKL